MTELHKISSEELNFDSIDDENRLQLMRGPRDMWRDDRDVQLRMLERLDLRPHQRVLEIGCGPLQAGAALIKFLDVGHYTGVDISQERIGAARDVVARFGLGDKNPQLVCSGDFGLDQLAPRSFDRIWCYQALIHFPQAAVERFFEAVSILLKPSGRAWVSARVSGTESGFVTVGKWLEFPVTEAGDAFYWSKAADAGLTCTSLGTLSDWGHPTTRPGSRNWLMELRHAPDD